MASLGKKQTIGGRRPRIKVAPAPKVSTTILEQIGGRQFIAMTGSRDFVGGEDFLQFTVPRVKDGNKWNKVRIKLEPNDTYTVEFFDINFRTATTRSKKSVEGVLFPELRAVFTSNTGMETSLGTMGRSAELKVNDKVKMLRRSSDAFGKVGVVKEIERDELGPVYFVSFPGHLGRFFARKRELESVR